MFVDNPWTEEDSDALEKLLLDNNIKVPPTLRLLRFEQVQQFLCDEGHRDLAANLRTQLNQGKCSKLHVQIKFNDITEL